MSSLVRVAVGAVIDAQGRVLIAFRPERVHQGGLWEFPGGKVDSGETLEQALRRELWEELGIVVRASAPLIRIRHDYPDKSVLLEVRKVTAFDGEACGKEAQPIRWVCPQALVGYQFPEANGAIIKALNLPHRLLITGPASSPADFGLRLEKALARGIRLVQLRLHEADEDSYLELARIASKLCRAAQAQLVANTSPKLWQRLPQGLGLHLNRHELVRLESRPVGAGVLFGASCHNAEEIEQARRLGVDYVTLSPIAPTQSHPKAQALGWSAFTELAERARVPVYALGGMTEVDFGEALHSGAQGIGGIGFAWPETEGFGR